MHTHPQTSSKSGRYLLLCILGPESQCADQDAMGQPRAWIQRIARAFAQRGTRVPWAARYPQLSCARLARLPWEPLGSVCPALVDAMATRLAPATRTVRLCVPPAQRASAVACRHPRAPVPALLVTLALPAASPATLSSVGLGSTVLPAPACVRTARRVGTGQGAPWV
jgi:hypothetical protein